MPNPALDPAIARALKHVFDLDGGMTAEQYGTYLEAVAVVAIGGIRGHQGEDHARGFLEAALKDLDNPSQTFVMPKRTTKTH